MNIRDAVANTRALMALHGLTDWTVKVTNAKTYGGQCHYGKREIRLSRVFTEGRSAEEVRATVLHEIAHALTPGHNHDAVWADVCRRIGGTGQRRFRSDVEVPARYRGTCLCSDHTWKRHKLTKRVIAYGGCPKCRTLITWVDTRTKTKVG